MKITFNKNEAGITITFQHGPTYLMKYEDIPDKWIDEEIDFTIDYWKYDAEPESDRKTISRDEARKEVIDEIKTKEWAELQASGIVEDFGCGTAWEDLKTELYTAKPFCISSIWDEAESWN